MDNNDHNLLQNNLFSNVHESNFTGSVDKFNNHFNNYNDAMNGSCNSCNYTNEYSAMNENIFSDDVIDQQCNENTSPPPHSIDPPLHALNITINSQTNLSEIFRFGFNIIILPISS